MKVRSAARTDVGRVRDGNEDSYLDRPPLFVVADGMGGHLAGDVASSTAIKKIESSIESAPPTSTPALAKLVRSANAEIFERARQDSSMSGMGTTCTMLLVSDDEAHIAHVGDSRAYLFRDGRLKQLTEDHTLVNRMVQEGRISADAAAHHPQRSIITRALGIDENVDVDTFSFDIRDGDRVLLCSDGLTSMVESDAIESVLNSETDPDAAARRLIELANESGGEDNITVILVDIRTDAASPAAGAAPVTSESPPPPPPPPAEPQDHRAEAVSRPRWRRRLVTTLIALVILGGVAYGAGRYALANSWFVGATETGNIAIYQGIPDEIAGFSFKEVEEESSFSVDELPESFQENVTVGIKVDSLEEARDTVSNLEQRAVEFRSETPVMKKDG